jgi:uncharacterized protein YkwD
MTMRTRLGTIFGYILAIGFCGLILFLIFTDQSGQQKQNIVVVTPTETPTPLQLNSDKIFNLVNDWRANRGLKPFIKSDTLCKLATERMPQTKIEITPHQGFIPAVHSGRYPYGVYGENLANGFYFNEAVLNGWINSPEHQTNLIHSYTYSCIETDGQYVVQEFASY